MIIFFVIYHVIIVMWPSLEVMSNGIAVMLALYRWTKLLILQSYESGLNFTTIYTTALSTNNNACFILKKSSIDQISSETRRISRRFFNNIHQTFQNVSRFQLCQYYVRYCPPNKCFWATEELIQDAKFSIRGHILITNVVYTYTRFAIADVCNPRVT